MTLGQLGGFTKADLIAKGYTPQAAQDELDAQLNRQFGGGMTNRELSDFRTLIGRLESSKMKQAAQANRARQRETMAGGLASMMTNF